jgi:hypothetical protein
LQVLCYNVGGLKSKLNDSSFLSFIRGYDIVFVLESFVVEQDYSFFEEKIPFFKLYFESAVRHANAGRAIGGSVLCVNLESPFYRNIQFESEHNVNFLKIKSNCENTPVLKIVPVYLNYNYWEENFDVLSNFLSENIGQKLVIIGDFNSRIGKEKTAIDLEEINLKVNFTNDRKSKDSVLNARGRKLLDMCENFSLFILNGRSISDKEGEFTFVNSQGASVIDLALVSVNMLSIVNDFEVISEPGTDHMPISIDLNLFENRDTSTCTLLPRLRWSEQDNLNYCENIVKELRNLNELESNQECINNIISAIKSAANHKNVTRISGGKVLFKQPWYDYKCLAARKRKCKLLKLFRKTNSDIVRKCYVEARKAYNLLCKQSKARYRDVIIEGLSHVSNGKQFWDLINSFKINNVRAVPNIEPHLWVEHFRSLLNPPIFAGNISYAEPYIVDQSLDNEFTLEELKYVLTKTKNGKAPGFDRVPYEFFKNGPDELISKVLKIFNRIYINGCVPDTFKRSIIYPLHKKGDKHLVSNYRGLSFIDCVAKLYASLIYNRLNTWVENKNILNEFQAGFRKQYSTVDNIFNLTSMISLQLSVPKGKLYCFFVDFKAAFDTIDRQSLFFKLTQLGISTLMLQAIKNLYNDTKSGVWCNNGVTDAFETTTGLKQGCICSSLLFSLFVNDIPDILEGGCNFGGHRVNVLLYADDLVLLAPTAGSLQMMINKLEEYCSTWNLVVNLTKSKIMVFRRGGKLKRTDKWFFEGKRIDVVNHYKYLGVSLTSKMSWGLHLNEKSTAAKLAMNLTWRNLINNGKVPIKTKFFIFNSIIRALGCYACQVWGYREHDTLEGVLRIFIKRIFALPENTPNYVLYLETGVDKLFIFTLGMHVKYLLKVLALPANRLPYKLAQKVIEKNVFWSAECRRLGRELGVDVVGFGGDQLMSLVEAARVAAKVACMERARSARHHTIYAILNLELGDHGYLTDNIPVNIARWVMKARAEIIDLNYKPWIFDKNYVCSLCNLQENENVFHFIARCPILNRVRENWFFKTPLSFEDFVEILNGWDWLRLGNYLKEAWSIRWQLVKEFNF